MRKIYKDDQGRQKCNVCRSELVWNYGKAFCCCSGGHWIMNIGLKTVWRPDGSSSPKPPFSDVTIGDQEYELRQGFVLGELTDHLGTDHVDSHLIVSAGIGVFSMKLHSNYVVKRKDKFEIAWPCT